MAYDPVYREALRRRHGIRPRDELQVRPCGTNAAYARGCRCVDCRRASAAYRRMLRREQGVLPKAPPRHGTDSCYTSGCRLPECRAAATEARRQRAQRARDQNATTDPT